ncbi:MAG: alpha-amylase family glycosyl hydrolase, partial [Robiginitalea sp.]|uniref:alpha-amylase family glycosyl hydrolase n=1 Tax=Robiginitalea sp. TaxID=1902411 RepID=UPI003C73A15C
LNLVFLFDISALEWNADFFRDKIQRIESFYPYPYTPTYVFSNHDRIRSISLLGNDLQKARALALLQLTLRGVPFYYQGEEIGIPMANIPGDQALDPLPAAFDWLPDFAKDEVINRDNCRTPMQWSARANAGFTEAGAVPWLPVPPGYKTLNVERQAAEAESLLATNKELLKIRSASEPLKWGSLKWMDEFSTGDVLAFQRIYQKDRVNVLINISEEEKSLTVGEGLTLLFAAGNNELSGNHLVLGPNSGVILK